MHAITSYYNECLPFCNAKAIQLNVDIFGGLPSGRHFATSSARVCSFFSKTQNNQINPKNNIVNPRFSSQCGTCIHCSRTFARTIFFEAKATEDKLGKLDKPGGWSEVVRCYALNSLTWIWAEYKCNSPWILLKVTVTVVTWILKKYKKERWNADQKTREKLQTRRSKRTEKQQASREYKKQSEGKMWIMWKWTCWTMVVT